MNESLKRKAIQITALIFTNPYVMNFLSGKIYKGSLKQFCAPGLNCYSCPSALLSCPIGTLQAVGGSPSFKFSFYVVGCLLLIGLLIGRAVCAFLCPFGLFQELLNKTPIPKINLWPPLTYLRFATLIICVILVPIIVTSYAGLGEPVFCEYICPAGTFEAAIPLLITHSEFRDAIGTLFCLKFTILIITILGCMTIHRFFCKVLCPLGAVYGLMNKFSLYRLKLDSSRCVKCGLCRRVCQMGVDPASEVDSNKCILCGDCVRSCPHGALKLR